MRFFFGLLYHPFAFAYDLVAAVVSFGQWKNWGQAIVPYIEGTHILELGHGPGHLQQFLLAQSPVYNQNLTLFALDESAQMSKLAKNRIGESQRLTRALAQFLPFQSNSFNSVISTFPTEYIFSEQTLSEVRRVLRNGGRLIVLPAALPNSVLLKWLYQFTGESPSELNEAFSLRLTQPFINAGFKTDIQTIEVKSSIIVIIIARLQ